MSNTFVWYVEPVLCADLDDLTVGQLQAHALELRAVAGRLLGRADQVLAAVHARSGGQVPESSLPLASGAVDGLGSAGVDDGEGGVSEACAAADAPAPLGLPLLMSVQAWWREATLVAGTQAGRDLRRAGVLSRFPVWGQAVTDGLLTPAQGEVLCRLDGKLPDTELLATQRELVTVAAALDPVELGQWVRHLIATWCEPELDREQDRAETGAWLQLDRRPDGRLAGRFVISGEDSEALLTVLEPLARRQGLTDARGAGRRRAEALVEVFTAATRWLKLPSAGGRPVHVSYVVPSGWACGGRAPVLADLLTGGYLTLQNAEPTDSPTLLSPDTDSPTLTDSASDDADINLTDLTDFTDGAGGWDGSGGSTTDASPPAPGPMPIRGWWQGPEPDPRPEQGRLVKSLTDPHTGHPMHPVVVEEHVATGAWSGPQTRARIEATLCDARISRVPRDAFGQVHSPQTLTDQITTAQRKAVSARDRHCTARGCTRPPAFTDLHHLIHREDFGHTTINKHNLQLRYLPGMTLAAVYARISFDPNDTALGVKRQIKDCQALAEARGWTVGEVFTDNDVSATRAKPRPAYQQMMGKLTAGAFQALICWDVDRLTRSPRELEDIVDLHERHGVQLACVGAEIDPGTPQGRLTARIKGSVAKHESEQLTRRVKAKMAERAEAGAPHGKVAYGWRREQVYNDTGRRLGSRDVIHPDQAAVVKDAAAAIAAGDSLRAVVARLNATGRLGVNGKPWSTTTLRGVLLRCSNVGLRLHRGEVLGKATWDSILDRDLYDRVVAILSDPSRWTSPASSAIKYLLSGIARCRVCGGPMRVLVVGKDGRKQDAYVCQDKFHVRRVRLPVEELVTETVLERLSQPDARKLLTAGDDTATQALREQAAAVRARLDSAADAYADGTIDGQQLTRITAKLRPEAERLDHLVKAASTAPDLEDIAGPHIRKRWESIPLSRQRATIQLLLTIEILPMPAGSRRDVFDPTTVRLTWRGADPPLASSAGPHRA